MTFTACTPAGSHFIYTYSTRYKRTGTASICGRHLPSCHTHIDYRPRLILPIISNKSITKTRSITDGTTYLEASCCHARGSRILPPTSPCTPLPSDQRPSRHACQQAPTPSMVRGTNIHTGTASIKGILHRVIPTGQLISDGYSVQYLTNPNRRYEIFRTVE